jgi:hypothetical protein
VGLREDIEAALAEAAAPPGPGHAAGGAAAAVSALRALGAPDDARAAVRAVLDAHRAGAEAPLFIHLGP